MYTWSEIRDKVKFIQDTFKVLLKNIDLMILKLIKYQTGDIVGSNQGLYIYVL